MGNPELAAQHFEDALAFCRNGGYRPELAWTCCDYADMLLERNGDDDRAKAMSLLDESLAISSELGMRPLMERGCCPGGRYWGPRPANAWGKRLLAPIFCFPGGLFPALPRASEVTCWLPLVHGPGR